MSDTTTPKGQALTPAIGGLYNWKGQPERLVYMGEMRYPGDPRPWHQFAKVEAPHMCWSEVLTSELAMFEETKGSQMTTNTTSVATETDNVTRLPDGSAFAIASFPLPDSHWLYAPREYAEGADVPKELPRPILSHTEHREAVVAAIRYAVRSATMCGKEPDFDPDALVQNAVYALCGPFGGRTTLAEKITLAAGQATAAQQGTAYAALPEYGINTASHAHFRVLGFTADQMRAFADATHTLRASQGQAPAQPDPAYSAACHLATALFKKYFAHLPDFASGQAVWGLCGSTAGVISQIDNMVSGLLQPPTTAFSEDEL